MYRKLHILQTMIYIKLQQILYIIHNLTERVIDQIVPRETVVNFG